MFEFELTHKDGIKKIQINFLSSYILDQLNMLQAGIVDVESKFNLLSDIQDYIDSGKLDRKTKKELKKEKKLVQEAILDYGRNGYLDKRWEIIKQLLIDNGCDDIELLDYLFWYKQVDRKEIKRFILCLIAYSIEGDE
jgi:hypothetical protein